MRDEIYERMISELGSGDDDKWMDKWGDQLGHCLNWWIEKNGYSKVRVAEKLKVHRGTIYKWIQAENRPSGKKRERLPRLLEGLQLSDTISSETLLFVQEIPRQDRALLLRIKKGLAGNIFKRYGYDQSEDFFKTVNSVERLFEGTVNGNLSADARDRLEEIAEAASIGGYALGMAKRASDKSQKSLWIERFQLCLRDLTELRKTTSADLWLKGFQGAFLGGYAIVMEALYEMEHGSEDRPFANWWPKAKHDKRTVTEELEESPEKTKPRNDLV